MLQRLIQNQLDAEERKLGVSLDYLRHGEEALVELALGIASARVFPVTKRALGYATSCALVQVEV